MQTFLAVHDMKKHATKENVKHLPLEIKSKSQKITKWPFCLGAFLFTWEEFIQSLIQNSNAYILLRYYHIYLSYKLQEVINIFPIHRWINWGSMDLNDCPNDWRNGRTKLISLFFKWPWANEKQLQMI